MMASHVGTFAIQWFTVKSDFVFRFSEKCFDNFETWKSDSIWLGGILISCLPDCIINEALSLHTYDKSYEQVSLKHKVQTMEKHFISK